jgi:hypothetical protein
MIINKGGCEDESMYEGSIRGRGYFSGGAMTLVEVMH